MCWDAGWIGASVYSRPQSCLKATYHITTFLKQNPRLIKCVNPSADVFNPIKTGSASLPTGQTCCMCRKLPVRISQELGRAPEHDPVLAY